MYCLGRNQIDPGCCYTMQTGRRFQISRIRVRDMTSRHIPGLPGVLRHSVKLRTSIPQDTSLRERVPSSPTWGIAPLCQTTDFIPEYIAERACPIQAYLGYCVVTPSNYGLLYPRIHRWKIVSHPGLPGVLRHSVKLRTSIPQDTSLRERGEQGFEGGGAFSPKSRSFTVNFKDFFLCSGFSRSISKVFLHVDILAVRYPG
jgi:hypothetical protein